MKALFAALLLPCLASASVPSSLPWIWEGDSEDELPVVEMEVNGQKVKAFFDTGANGITMGEKTARRLGLLEGEGVATGTGVFAGGRESSTIELPPVTLLVGKTEFRSFPAKVVRGADSQHRWRDITVGVELLRRARVLVDYRAKTLRVLDRGVLGTAKNRKKSVSLPFEFVKGTHLMIVKGTINGRETRLHFDTGGTFALNVFSPTARLLHLKVEGRKYGGSGGGGAGVTQVNYRQSVRLCLKKICEKVTPMAIEGQDKMWEGVNGLYGKRVEGQISHQFLSSKLVEYDIANRRIWIRKK